MQTRLKTNTIARVDYRLNKTTSNPTTNPSILPLLTDIKNMQDEQEIQKIRTDILSGFSEFAKKLPQEKIEEASWIIKQMSIVLNKYKTLEETRRVRDKIVEQLRKVKTDMTKTSNMTNELARLGF